MNRSVKHLVAAVGASALVSAGAPAAQAQGLGPCTFAYVDDVSQTSSGPIVTYTPLATITVHGDTVLGVANYLVGATRDYVQCLMMRG